MVKITLWVWIAAILMLSVSETHTLADDVFAQATAWSPDGQFVAVGMSDGTLHIVDAVTLSIVNTFDTDHGSVRALAWEKIGTRLAVGADHEIIIWDSVIQLELARINTQAGDIDSLRWSPDGVYLASSSQNGFPNNVQIWDISAQRKIFSPVVGDVLSVAWSPDSSQLAITKFGEIQLWNVLEQVQTNIIHTTEYSVDLVWSRDGLSLASGDGYAPGEATVRLWDADSGRLLRSFIGHQDAITEVDWSIDGEWLATSSHDGTVRIWNALSGDTVQLYEGLGSSFGAAFSPYGGRLAYGQTFNPGSSEPPFQIVVPAPSLERLTAITALCVRDGDSRAVSLIDSAPTALDDLPAFVAQVEALPDGAIPPACKADVLAVASALSTVSPTVLSQDASDEDVTHITSVAWSPDGGKIATATNTGRLYVWDVATDSLLHEFQAHEGSIYSISWNPDGSRLASISPHDGLVRIWDTLKGNLVAELMGDRNPLDAALVAWNPNGTIIVSATANTDGGFPLHFWDVEADTYQPLLVSAYVSAFDVAWSPDGEKLAVADYRDVYLFDDFSSQSLEPEPMIPFRYAIAWSPDGAKLAAANLDGTIQILNPETREILTSIGNIIGDTPGRPASIIWDNHSDNLFVDRFDGSTEIWNTSTSEIIETLSLQRQGGRGLMTLSPYSGRLALGNSVSLNNRSPIQVERGITQTLADGAIQIVVPAPSLERLTAITALCVRDGDSRAESLADSAPTVLDDLPAFVAQVEALPDGAIPPACRADVLAVASALGN